MAYSQDNRLIAIESSLGADVLLLTSFQGREEMSRLFSYELTVLSETHDIAPQDIVGKAVTFLVRYDEEEQRYFHGYVNRWSALGMQGKDLRRYEAGVVPWLWFLTQTSDCRVFQEKSVIDIAKQLFGEYGFADYTTAEVKGDHATRTYCVQYRETDFAFLSRLFEEEGIFYFFKHEQGKHTLVLADRKTAYKDCEENEVPIRAGSHPLPHITSWSHSFCYHAGKWTQQDYNPDTPSTDLTTTESTLVDLPNISSYEHYDYPGRYPVKAVGAEFAKVRIETEEAGHDVVTGIGNCATFTLAGKFKVTEFEFDDDLNKIYAITSIEHEARDESYFTAAGASTSYGNHFTCIPDSVLFRPERLTPKPIVHGPHTAVVVGPSGEEIYTDDQGRVKIQFHWDREGGHDDKSSCWVRVSQGWAGATWGIVFHPRIGQEVVVSFLEGDPDRPLITGRVYNAEKLPDADAAATNTQSVIRTRTSPDGGADNFNELRFEDAKDSEKITFHAERDFERIVENNDTLTVGYDKKDAGDQTIDIYNNRTVTLEEGTDTLTIKKGDRIIAIDEGNDELTVSKGDQTITIDEGDQTITISQGDQTITIDQGKCTIEAGTSIELIVGESSIKIESDAITIASSDIAITGDMSAEVSAPDTTVSADGNLTIDGGQVAIN